MKLWFTWYGANTVDKSLPVLSTLIVVVVLLKRVKVDKCACLSKFFHKFGTFCPEVRRGTREWAFIYALSADENRPALAAPRHASTALFSCRFKSCRFKCPCPPRRQRHFHDNADRAYNTLHFASQSRVPNGGVAPFGNPHKKRRYATPPRGAYRLFLLSSPPAVLVEQKSAWDWCGIFI